MASSLYLRRKAVNKLALVASIAAAVAGLAWLLAILWILCAKGLAGLEWSLFTQMTPPPGGKGGLANAFAGSLAMTLIGMALATPVGILAGTYLAEYAEASKLATVIRFINDILLSAPSIIIGLFVYEAMVIPFGHFSGWAGGIALGVVALPVIVRTTEDMLKLVPRPMHEAAFALGAPRWKVISSVAYRVARAGIITAVLLALARVSGETAPLLFTSLNNQFWSTNMNAPMASLPVVIFQFALSPYADWQQLAWSGALVVTLAVLGCNIAARLLGREKLR